MTTHTTYEQRIQIRALRGIGWGYRHIASHLHLSRDQVIYWSRHPPKPAERRGRHKIIDATQRRRIVEFITQNASTRQMAFWEVGRALGLNVSEETIRDAVLREGLSRRVAHVKPFLSEWSQLRCLSFAEEHFSWSDNTWGRVLWTDESAMHILGKERTWVTRCPDEAYDMDCLVPTFKKLSGCMVLGAISGYYGTGN